MYVRRSTTTGTVDATALARVPVTWNPPGWGSYSGLDLQTRIGPLVPGIWRLAMLVGLQPQGTIPRHRDAPADENGLAGMALDRWHVVLVTNPHAWCYHGGVWQHLERGGIYAMDPTVDHAAVNWGDTVRWHLVVDTERA